MRPCTSKSLDQHNTPYLVITDSISQVGRICWRQGLQRFIPHSLIDWPRVRWESAKLGFPDVLPLKRWPGTNNNWSIEFKSTESGRSKFAGVAIEDLPQRVMRLQSSAVLSKWVGEAEQNVRKLFEAARQEERAIIFIDEVEALVPRRKGDSSAVMQRVVPQILQELEGFDRSGTQALLFVGATNKPWMLDEAILRPGRLDARVYVGLHDAPARFKLLEIYLGKRPIADDVDFGDLCDRLVGYSGADIKNIAQRAAQLPFMEAIKGSKPRAISKADVESVIEKTLPSVKPADLVRFEKFENTGK